MKSREGVPMDMPASNMTIKYLLSIAHWSESCLNFKHKLEIVSSDFFVETCI